MENIHATTADAELILRLYDLRRESEMRKARDWFAAEFWPATFAELERTAMNFGSPQSRWFGQVLSYWDMAAALVVRGALNPGLFLDTCHEAWFCYAKLRPFIAEGRAKFAPEFLRNLEKAIEGTPEGRERLRRTEENIARFRTLVQQSAKQQSNAAAEAA